MRAVCRRIRPCAVALPTVSVGMVSASSSSLSWINQRAAVSPSLCMMRRWNSDLATSMTSENTSNSNNNSMPSHITGPNLWPLPSFQLRNSVRVDPVKPLRVIPPRKDSLAGNVHPYHRHILVASIAQSSCWPPRLEKTPVYNNGSAIDIDDQLPSLVWYRTLDEVVEERAPLRPKEGSTPSSLGIRLNTVEVDATGKSGLHDGDILVLPDNVMYVFSSQPHHSCLSH
jgi:hypothetical protein